MNLIEEINEEKEIIQYSTNACLLTIICLIGTVIFGLLNIIGIAIIFGVFTILFGIDKRYWDLKKYILREMEGK